MGQARIHILISGRVQGVFFRYFTQQKAEEIGAVGWVRNVSDGRVEVLAEGEKEVLERLLEACSHGPEYARVDHISHQWEESQQEFTSFKTARTAFEPRNEHPHD